MSIDFSNEAVVDAHCHGFDAESLLNRSPEGFLNRLTVMGMCFATASALNPNLAKTVSAMTDDSIFAMLGRRQLAQYLDCSPEEVSQVRRAALETNPDAYVSNLLADEGLTALFVDEGFPLPPIDQFKMQRLTSLTIHRVVRIEPLIEQARQSTSTVSELEDAFREHLAEAANDPRCVAFKSIIAYRTGLDVGEPDRDEVAGSYQRWRAANWQEGRSTSKGVRDHLLNVTLEVAKRHDRPVHIHSGAGDTDVVLSHARPSLLAPLLTRASEQPVVLIHSGFPWLEEATYLGALYPLAYLELSLFLPWATLDIDRILNMVLGAVPTSKIFYGSDEASEPEILWLSAKLARAALARVLTQAVERDYLTRAEAERIGPAVLGENVLKLHGLST